MNIDSLQLTLDTLLFFSFLFFFFCKDCNKIELQENISFLKCFWNTVRVKREGKRWRIREGKQEASKCSPMKLESYSHRNLSLTLFLFTYL